jgi:transcriptional regulator with XRE-family HTH domain
VPNELSKAFGKALHRERQRKGWSQMKLAQEAGLHLNTLGKLESGTRNPSLHTIVALCRALNVPLGKFMSAVEFFEDRK